MKLIIVLTVTVFCLAPLLEARPGGLSEEKPANDEVRKLVKELEDEVEKKAKNEFESLEPLVYTTQVVAGINYFVKVRAVDEDSKEVSYLHLRIYKPLGHKLPAELTSLKVAGEKDKLEHFSSHGSTKSRSDRCYVHHRRS